jgi:hypothetical protein
MGPHRFENSRDNLLTSQWHEKNSAPVFLLPGPGVVYEITERRLPRCYPSALTLPPIRARHPNDVPLFPDHCP